jgi:hypothetical protein
MIDWIFLILIICGVVWLLTRKKERKDFPSSVKWEIRQKQHDKCADCKK